MDAARAWVAETLGELAVDADRSAMFRETARIFLETASYSATADDDPPRPGVYDYFRNDLPRPEKIPEFFRWLLDHHGPARCLTNR